MTPAVRRILTQLTALRMANGWSQHDTAQAAGLDKKYLSVIERGIKSTRAETIDQLAGLYGLELTLAPAGLVLVETPDDLWREMRAIRLGLGLTLADITRATGIHESNLSAYENQRRQPDTATALRVLVALGCRIAVAGARKP